MCKPQKIKSFKGKPLFFCILDVDKDAVDQGHTDQSNQLHCKQVQDCPSLHIGPSWNKYFRLTTLSRYA